jgi:hypothetical protein
VGESWKMRISLFPEVSALLVVLALGCSGSGTTPPDENPELPENPENPEACSTPVGIAAEPASTTVSARSQAESRFRVSNGCQSSSGPWNLTAIGTGTVVSVGTPSPAVLTLPAGGSQEVAVPLTSGDPGAGTVQLTATFQPSPARTASGSQTVRVPEPAPAPEGLPFGPFSLWKDPTSTHTVGVSSFTMSYDGTTWSHQGGQPHILSRIAAARAQGLKLVLAMTGGGHERYTTDGRFDIEKWKHGNPLFPGSGMDGYDNPEIKAAVEQAVADGVILGNSVMDEPSRWRSWGTKMNKPIVDSMCAYTKRIFPTLPVGALAVHWWRPQERYGVCDFIISQFEYDVMSGGDFGSETPAAFRDEGLRIAATNGVSIVFSLNILDGGPSGAGCGNDCPMSADQLRHAGLTLGPEGSGLLLWRYDAETMGQQVYQSATEDIADELRSLPFESWRRTR